MRDFCTFQGIQLPDAVFFFYIYDVRCFRGILFGLTLLVVLKGTLWPLCEASPMPGLRTLIRQGTKQDSFILKHFAFYSGTNDSAGIGVTNGQFALEITGFITVDLRAQYRFAAELNGSFELEVNGAEVMKASETDGRVQAAKAVRLKKGTNSIVARFTPSQSGETYFRVLWAARDWPAFIPVPSSALSAEPGSEAFRESVGKRHGALLLTKYHCVRCHSTDFHGFPELEADAPSFEAIGSRLSQAWMAACIENPEKIRADARMPRLFGGEDGPAKARSVAAYLSTLKGDSFSGGGGSIENGAQLYKSLNCAACHETAGNRRGAISLASVGVKFKGGALARYLRSPEAYYRWNPMPNFKLSAGEADDLAAYLTAGLNQTVDAAPTADQIQMGKKLLATSGCLNCHSAGSKERIQFTDLAGLNHGASRGCLGESASAAPQFAFLPGERAELERFIRDGDFTALGVSISREFADRQIARLHCAECHDKVEGLPRLSLAGMKLNPKWSASFIAGAEDEKPRPWLAMRMPGFPAYANGIARGLAAANGLPFQAPSEPPVNHEAAAMGEKLASAAGGFSCVACHGTSGTGALSGVEAPGVSFALSGQRLLKSFFQRWVLNPTLLDPATKMPVFFDAHGASQLLEYYDGDGKKQIDALWEYIRSLESPH